MSRVPQKRSRTRPTVTPRLDPAAQAVETLRQFVIRAIHIETHSLVADRERLARDAEGTTRIRVELDGTTHIEREFPDDERMESLASRVRPLTLSEEPIHYNKVMKAIGVILHSDGRPRSDELYQRVADLRRLWRRYGLDKDSEVGYWHSAASADGSEPTVEVTDVQLAACWFYSDVAHANPDGWKAEALTFSRSHRFEAGVSRFSMLALAALQTLDFMRELRDEGLVEIPPAAFEQDLATSHDIPEKTLLMWAPPGTPPPGPAGTPAGQEWTRMNVVEAARLASGNRVDIVLTKDDEEVLRRPGAIVEKSHPDDHTYGMQVLVDDAVIFTLTANTKDPAAGVMRSDNVWKTNRALSDGVRLLNVLHASDTIRIVWNDRDLFRFAVEASGQTPYGHVTADYADDVSAIEVIAVTALPLIDKVPTSSRRTEVHVARLAMEGHLVDGVRGPVTVTVPAGGPPQAIDLQVRPLDVGGVEIPLGPLVMWHPHAEAEALGEPGEYKVSVPPGEAFRVWNPNARNMLPDSDFTPTATLASHSS